MYRSTLIALLAFAAVAFAQEDKSGLFDKAPPDVERALRARITEFYQYHVTGQFLKAQPMVAEDTQEYFYASGKPRFISFEIQHIKYNKDFTLATSSVMVERSVMLPGFNGQIMKMPVVDQWKFENGNWFWWMDPEKRNMTPFSPKPAVAGEMVGGTAPSMGNIPMSVDEFYARVQADKSAVSIKVGESDTVSIGNSLVGPISPHIVTKPNDVEVTFSEKQIAPSAKGTVTIKAGEKAESGDLVIRIDPIGKEITIQVAVRKQ
jgi:hypothetical protein